MNLTTFDQAELERLVHDQLVRLNEKLAVGLGEDELIKTRAYRLAKEPTFLTGFGQAARVRA